ncbi:FAD-binding oxidoreductase [Actinospica durhamensis]|uniref:FAD-binding oxidoreductase n=1 Tax=Actinospica durhamensis TaxID=1508375 RepID=A0A941ENA1_9ACTN|nr:FAD-binding oxidoreductase [Actinospica durhamensis]MBR7834391.1 FAD-binding oxidoreductase [Actinospica durhamensis]
MSETLQAGRATLEAAVRGEVHWHGGPGYEQARLDSVWNARKPAAYPAVIVIAADDRDVAAAVDHAREHGLKVTVRSGGHSWYGIHLRGDCLLLDLSRLRGITVDPQARTAAVGSGVVGLEVYEALAEHDLFFPVGHGPDVGLAGFLLGGGYGWNSGHLGPACFSIAAVDVVTAAGEFLYCDETQNTDFLWAARGGGHGQFAVITRFHLRLYRPPGAIVRSVQVYPKDMAGEVTRWMTEVGPKLEDRVEFIAMVTPPPIPGFEGAATITSATVFADSFEEAVALLAPFEDTPFAGRELLRVSYDRTDMHSMGREVERETPKGRRYICDNIWTRASAEEITPLIQQAADTMPNPECQIFWYWWGADRTAPHAAWSAQAPWYYAVYGIGADPALDAAHDAWVAGSIAAVAHLSAGTQFADSNLAGRFDGPLRAPQLAEMDRLRARHDPAGVFPGYPGVSGS